MPSLRDFCDELTDRARRALSIEHHERRFSLGGATVTVRCAGERLVEIIDPALAHARVADAEEGKSGPHDLEVWMWDRRATGIAPPPPAWPLTDHLPTGAIRGLSDGPIRVHFDRWQQVLTVFDLENRRFIIHAADAELIPSWVVRSPLRPVLTTWAAQNEWAMVHAGAVATPGGAVMLAGSSGAGKSTTTLMATLAGLGFMGDDACLVTFDPEPTAHTVFGMAKLEADAFDRLPMAHQLAVRADAAAHVLDPTSLVVRNAPLRAVALLSIGDSDGTTAQRLGRADALRQLVECGIDEGAATTLSGLRRLATEIPCVALSLGRDSTRVVDAVRSLGEGFQP